MTHHPSLQPVAEDWNNALAVVAHPDDLEYGTASAIARWTSQGKDVDYLIVTRGEAGLDATSPDQAGPLRADEERKSAAVVGVERVEFLDGYRDGVIEYGTSLRKDITRAIRAHRPDVLITVNFRLTWSGGFLNMADHRAVGMAVLDAARDAGNRWIFPELLDDGLSPWTGVRMVLVSASPQPTHAVNVDDFLDRGIESLRQHKTYLSSVHGDDDPGELIRRFATQTGEAFGCKYAVSFEVLTV